MIIEMVMTAALVTGRPSPFSITITPANIPTNSRIVIVKNSGQKPLRLITSVNEIGIVAHSCHITNPNIEWGNVTPKTISLNAGQTIKTHLHLNLRNASKGKHDLAVSYTTAHPRNSVSVGISVSAQIVVMGKGKANTDPIHYSPCTKPKKNIIAEKNASTNQSPLTLILGVILALVIIGFAGYIIAEQRAKRKRS